MMNEYKEKEEIRGECLNFYQEDIKDIKEIIFGLLF